MSLSDNNTRAYLYLRKCDEGEMLVCSDLSLLQTFPYSVIQPSLTFAQLTRILTIRHDTSDLRAIWEFDMDQI